MKVLVTGGAGYIGSVLVRMLLEKGYGVTVLDRFFFGEESLKEISDRIKIIKDDVRWANPSVLDGIDAVIDMAALSNDPVGELDSSKTLDINYLGRVRIAKLSKMHNVKRYIAASSCSVYGFREGAILNEGSEANPLTTYAKANVLWENDVLPLAGKNFAPTVLRQATVYGASKRMRFDLAINGMALSLYKDKKLNIQRDGKQWRPFVHVKDTSNAFIKVLESEESIVSGQIFNVGSDEQNVQVLDLAKIAAAAVGMEFDYEWYGSPDKRSYKVSFGKIEKTLGYKTRYTPKDGAKEVYDQLVSGELDGEDNRTITIKWYKNLINMNELLEKTKLNGVLL